MEAALAIRPQSGLHPTSTQGYPRTAGASPDAQDRDRRTPPASKIGHPALSFSKKWDFGQSVPVCIPLQGRDL